MRVDYEGPLSHQLDPYLRPKQYILWTKEQDERDVSQRLLNAMEGTQTFDRLPISKLDRTASQPVSTTAIAGRQIVEPQSHFDPLVVLEAPTGAVDLERRMDPGGAR